LPTHAQAKHVPKHARPSRTAGRLMVLTTGGAAAAVGGVLSATPVHASTQGDTAWTPSSPAPSGYRVPAGRRAADPLPPATAVAKAKAVAAGSSARPPAQAETSSRQRPARAGGRGTPHGYAPAGRWSARPAGAVARDTDLLA